MFSLWWWLLTLLRMKSSIWEGPRGCKVNSQDIYSFRRRHFSSVRLKFQSLDHHLQYLFTLTFDIHKFLISFHSSLRLLILHLSILTTFYVYPRSPSVSSPSSEMIEEERDMIEKNHQHDYRANLAKTKVLVVRRERKLFGKTQTLRFFLWLIVSAVNGWERKGRNKGTSLRATFCYFLVVYSFLLPFFSEFNDYYHEGRDGGMVMMMCLLQSSLPFTSAAYWMSVRRWNCERK